jgi:hypothetical protein
MAPHAAGLPYFGRGMAPKLNGPLATPAVLTKICLWQ